MREERLFCRRRGSFGNLFEIEARWCLFPHKSISIPPASGEGGRATDLIEIGSVTVDSQTVQIPPKRLVELIQAPVDFVETLEVAGQVRKRVGEFFE